jgi:hypothetical protein
MTDGADIRYQVLFTLSFKSISEPLELIPAPQMTPLLRTTSVISKAGNVHLVVEVGIAIIRRIFNY